jgi:hypothetical protein
VPLPFDDTAAGGPISSIFPISSHYSRVQIFLETS